MHPLGVILAILSGAELAGMAGIFLAIPAVAVLSVMHRHLLEHRGSGGLVSELLKPTPPPRTLRARRRMPWREADPRCLAELGHFLDTRRPLDGTQHAGL